MSGDLDVLRAFRWWRQCLSLTVVAARDGVVMACLGKELGLECRSGSGRRKGGRRIGGRGRQC
jgi:hypothetical protein